MQWIFTHFPRGLPTSSLFFFAISPLILKGLVPILQHLCRIFRNTPTFSLSDGFQRSYGYLFWEHTFFGPPCILYWSSKLIAVSKWIEKSEPKYFIKTAPLYFLFSSFYFSDLLLFVVSDMMWWWDCCDGYNRLLQGRSSGVEQGAGLLWSNLRSRQTNQVSH